MKHMLFAAVLFSSLLGTSCASESARKPPVVAALPPIATVIDWALGPEHRAPSPPTPDAELVMLPVGKPLSEAKKATPGCIHASAVLPSPGDGRVLLIVDGALYVRAAHDKDPVLLKDFDRALHLTRLLGAAEAGSPLRLLATGIPKGSRTEELWQITVGESAVLSMTPVTKGTAFSSSAAFLKEYRSPRCLSGGKQCLLLNVDHGQCYLDIEPSRGMTPKSFADLGETDVRDVAWADRDGKTLYLLMGCTTH